MEVTNIETASIYKTHTEVSLKFLVLLISFAGLFSPQANAYGFSTWTEGPIPFRTLFPISPYTGKLRASPYTGQPYCRRH